MLYSNLSLSLSVSVEEWSREAFGLDGVWWPAVCSGGWHCACLWSLWWLQETLQHGQCENCRGCIRDSVLLKHCFFKSVLIHHWTIALILSQEVSQSQVLETKIFHSPYGTGVAILTGTLRFTLATNIDDIKLRRLPEIPGKKCIFLCYYKNTLFHMVL